MYYMIYQLETDGEMFIKAFESMYYMYIFVRQNKLAASDYAIIEGNLIKSFDTKI